MFHNLLIKSRGNSGCPDLMGPWSSAPAHYEERTWLSLSSRLLSACFTKDIKSRQNKIRSPRASPCHSNPIRYDVVRYGMVCTSLAYSPLLTPSGPRISSYLSSFYSLRCLPLSGNGTSPLHATTNESACFTPRSTLCSLKEPLTDQPLTQSLAKAHRHTRPDQAARCARRAP